MRLINISKIIRGIKDYKKTKKKYPIGRFKLTKKGKLITDAAGNKDGFGIKMKPKKPKKNK